MKHIILFSIDTLRFDSLDMNCNHSKNLTPFFNSIQNQCIQFTKAYSGGPYTQAAFPGILSSSHYLEYGKTKGHCPRERYLISELLQSAGYTTAAFHSNAYLSGFFGWNRGWGTFYDSMAEQVSEQIPYIQAKNINKKVEHWLSKISAERSIFLWLHYMDAHEPYMPAPEFQKIIDADLKMSEEEMFAIFKEVVLKRNCDSLSQVRLAKKLYDAQTAAVDYYARDFFNILDQYLGLENCIVFIVSDHGEEFCEHGGLSHDGKMYDELVHVPFLIYDQALTEKKTIDKIVSTLDIPPTIAHLANMDAHPSWQGKSLFPLEQYDHRRGVYGEAIDKKGPRELGNEAEVHYYREGDYKIIYTACDDRWEVFDLTVDPTEKKSIYGENSTSEYLMKKLIPRIDRSNSKNEKIR